MDTESNGVILRKGIFSIVFYCLFGIFVLNVYLYTPTRLHCIKLNIIAYLLGKWKQHYGAPSSTIVIMHYLVSLGHVYSVIRKIQQIINIIFKKKLETIFSGFFPPKYFSSKTIRLIAVVVMLPST